MWRDHSLHGRLHMVPLTLLLDYLFPSLSPSAPPPPPPSRWARLRPSNPLPHLSWQKGAVGVLFKLKVSRGLALAVPGGEMGVRGPFK